MFRGEQLGVVAGTVSTRYLCKPSTPQRYANPTATIQSKILLPTLPIATFTGHNPIQMAKRMKITIIIPTNGNTLTIRRKVLGVAIGVEGDTCLIG